ncbi:riboflavin synthase [Gulosibacter molinativorax]|uniref:Riboflavin synthase n=1 Tax=Gulosibacter molinativorax TaxID=256821 RepID=A0ABT7C8G7_9MICO|nr:riboflavin synthase [Gulosibacter molinativorax]MDJ1371480.1 riboflavin synthase subunit alpha [Gulosibacter molinativorax]QUY62420.1 Riboflavin synthase [Gulosibacter molinativorax]
MFTGLIEEVGTVVGLEQSPTRPDAVITVQAATVTEDARPGDSIAVSGVCLTVVELLPDGAFTADVMPETIDRSTLSGFQPGTRVNLERAMRADARLGGHIVQGHVDAVATLERRTPGERWDDLRFRLDGGLTRYIAEKGSITIDGTSLTVTEVDDAGFGVSIIPTTSAATTIGALAVGDRVNIEVDVLAKYVERALTARFGQPDDYQPAHLKSADSTASDTTSSRTNEGAIR